MTAGTSRAVAAEFVRRALADGPRPQADVVAEGVAAGLTARSVQRARRDAGVTSRKDGMSGPWVWSLADDEQETT